MGSAINEIIKRRVIEQWLSGEARDRIASDLQIGAGTVSGIVSDLKKNLQGSDIDTVRELALEVRKHGLNLSELASHLRLYNYFIKSGAAEEKVEFFPLSPLFEPFFILMPKSSNFYTIIYIVII